MPIRDGAPKAPRRFIHVPSGSHADAELTNKAWTKPDSAAEADRAAKRFWQEMAPSLVPRRRRIRATPMHGSCHG